MLLKFAGIKKLYAIGMRWAVDDRKGIEAIQFNTGLHYGVMLDLKEKGGRTLKLVALADETHKSAICLAGMLASQYDNLILVHRMSDALYWVCVIRNHAVWTGVDVPKATAGDFVSSFAAITDVIEAAKTEFQNDGISIENSLISTETASEDFPDFTPVNFYEFLSKLKKDSKYSVRYLEPSKILLRKILVLIVLIVAALTAAYYIQQQRLVTRLLYQQQIEQERQRQMAIQAEHDYFAHIQMQLQNQWGQAVLENVLTILNFIPLQSAGWNLTSAVYNSENPKAIMLSLTRSPYGTVDSFLYAYSKTPTNGAIESNNNTGVKTLTFNHVALKTGISKISKDSLIVDIPRSAYQLISYMQLNQETFRFQLKNKQRSQYGVYSTSFTIGGDKLWQLVQLENVLLSFPTLVIFKINFIVGDYDMSWILEGEIYA